MNAVNSQQRNELAQRELARHEVRAFLKFGYRRNKALQLKRTPFLASLLIIGGPDEPSNSVEWRDRRDALRGLFRKIVVEDLPKMLPEQEVKAAKKLFRTDSEEASNERLMPVLRAIDQEIYEAGEKHFHNSGKEAQVFDAVVDALLDREKAEAEARRKKTRKPRAKQKTTRPTKARKGTTKKPARKRTSRPQKTRPASDAPKKSRPKLRPEPPPPSPPQGLRTRIRKRPFLLAAIAFLLALAVGPVVVPIDDASKTQPVAGEVIRSFAISSAPEDLAATGGFAWLADSDTESVTRIAEDGTRTRYFLDHPPSVGHLAGLGVQIGGYRVVAEPGGRALIVVNDGMVLSVGDASTVRPWAKVRPAVEAAALYKRSLWIALGEGRILRLNERTSRFERLYELRHTATGLPSQEIAAGVGSLWVLESSRIRHLAKLTPLARSMTVREEFLPLGDPAVDLAAGLGALWTVNGNGTMTRYNPAFGTSLPIHVPGGAKMLALSRNAIWIGTEANSVVRLDPVSRKVVGEPIPLPERPVGIVAGRNVWVATAHRLFEIKPNSGTRGSSFSPA